MPGLYALLLIVSIAGLATIDHRYTLAWFYDRTQTAIILGITLAVFILWDIAGILLNIFRIGDTSVLIGLRIGEFPVEEFFFLVLLNYSSLIVYTYLRKRAGSR